MVASLECAKELIKECQCSRDAAWANNGILIGSGKIEHSQKDEGEAIHPYNNEIQTAEVACSFRSAYLPMHNEGAGDTLYRTGHDIIALQGNREICIKLIKFYLVEHDYYFTPFASCDAFQFILDGDGNQIWHQLSDTIYMKPFQTSTCIGIHDSVRPIMLWPEPDVKFAIVDHSRTNIPLPKVIVSGNPQPADMVGVKGDHDDIWHAEERQIYLQQKRVKGYFFVKHVHWERNHLWIREASSRAMDGISFKTIIDILPGI